MATLLGRGTSSFGKASPYRCLPRRRPEAERAEEPESDPSRRTRASFAVAAIVLAVLGLLTRLVAARVARLEVEGVSMIPTYAPGDRVLVLKTRDVSVGDVVALRDPDAAHRVLVKRVVGLDRTSVRVEGDNAGASRDSRDFGPVPRSAMVGRVITRYHSPHRRRLDHS